MRPSSILTFEPGLEHGVPWGRDLFTFVTSAAGHMMRTLQKPRKNKPSKRQVNHRRFLHNMIQRKFAEIEAANHQLASALFSTDKPPNHLAPRLSRIVTEVTDQSPKLSKRAIETFINVDKPDALPEQQDDVCDFWTLDSLMETHVADKSCKAFSSRSLRTDKDWRALKTNPGILVEKDIELHFERQPASTDFEDSVPSWFGSFERTRTHPKPCSKHPEMKLLSTGVDVQDVSPPSPVISLLSLDSCDFEVQMLIDAEHNAQTQDATITESLDMVDDLDLLDCSDDHGDLQIHNNNPKCKIADWMAQYEEGLQETNMFPSCLDSGYDLTSSGSETNNYTCSLGQEFDGFCNQESHGSNIRHNPINYNSDDIVEDHFGCDETIDLSITDGIVSSHHMFPELENQLDSQSKKIPYDNWEQQTLKHYSLAEKDRCIMMQDTDIRNADENIIQVEHLDETGSCVQFPITCCSEGFCYQNGESCCYSKFRANESSHNFDGVARSFPATLHKIHPSPIPTPPLDDDWLFSNIVVEEEVNCISNTFEKYQSVTG